jgi:hypothetical protein
LGTRLSTPSRTILSAKNRSPLRPFAVFFIERLASRGGKLVLFGEIGKFSKKFEKLVEVRDNFGYNTYKLIESGRSRPFSTLIVCRLRSSEAFWRPADVRVASFPTFSARLY